MRILPCLVFRDGSRDFHFRQRDFSRFSFDDDSGFVVAKRRAVWEVPNVKFSAIIFAPVGVDRGDGFAVLTGIERGDLIGKLVFDEFQNFQIG